MASADMGPFAILEGPSNKGKATPITLDFGAMVDLQAWIVVQSSEDGSCDADGGHNH